MRAALLSLALGVGLLTAMPATATTAPPLTFVQQARKADVVVRATLGAAVTVTEGGIAYAVYPLTVAETVVGDAGSLPQYQGRPALYVLQGLADLPTLGAGQEVIALLYARRLDSPIVGFNQGLYVVKGGKVAGARDSAGKDIADLTAVRDAILAARAAR